MPILVNYMHLAGGLRSIHDVQHSKACVILILLYSLFQNRQKINIAQMIF